MSELFAASVIMKFEDGGDICRINNDQGLPRSVLYVVNGDGYTGQFRIDLDENYTPKWIRSISRGASCLVITKVLPAGGELALTRDFMSKIRTFSRKTGLLEFTRDIPVPDNLDMRVLKIPTFDLDASLHLDGPYGKRVPPSEVASSDDIFDPDEWKVNKFRSGTEFIPRLTSPLMKLWMFAFPSTEFSATVVPLDREVIPGQRWFASPAQYTANFTSVFRAITPTERQAVVTFIGHALGRLPPEEESWWWEVNSSPGALVGIDEEQMELYELLDEVCPMLWSVARWREWALEVALPEWIMPS